MIDADIRHNNMAGVYREEDDMTNVDIHFAEWWNGEGLDFTLTDGKRISLSTDELKALAVIAIATKMVDIKDCLSAAEEMLKQSAQRDADIERIRSSKAE